MAITYYNNAVTGDKFEVTSEEDLQKYGQEYGSKRNFITLVKGIEIQNNKLVIEVGNGNTIIT